MEFRHGGLALTLPDDWSDQSTLLFVAPPKTELLPTQATVEPTTEAVSVSLLGDADREPRDILAAHAEQLKRADVGFKLISESAFACGFGAGWSYVQELNMDGSVVRQLAVAVRAGPHVCVLATAACPTGRFAACEASLRAILESIKPSPAP